MTRVRQEHPDGDRVWSRAGSSSDLVQGLLDGAEERFCREAEEVDGNMRPLKRTLEHRSEADGPGGALANEHPAALSRDDQPFVSERADRLLNGHAGDPVPLGEFGT
jgi:hypothetical protein